MALRSRGRKLSFDVLSATTATLFDDEDVESLLYRSEPDPLTRSNGDASELPASEPKPSRRKRKNRGSKKKKKRTIECSISEDSVLEVNCKNYSVASVVCEEVTVAEDSGGSVCTVRPVRDAEFHPVKNSSVGELRQRNVVGGVGSGSGSGSGGGGGGGGGGCEEAESRIDENSEESGCTEVDSVSAKKRAEPIVPNGNPVRKLETIGSLDWKRLMAQDPNNVLSVEKSPLKYFTEEMQSGNSLQSTTTLGNDKEREQVYDTMFRLPWRCELLIDVGFFVCFDSFLSLLTIMPARILMTFWRLFKTGQFERPSAAELSDFGCFLVLACGVALLEQTDISLIYHMIRGQGTIKLYVVYNVLEIFDKLCQNFGGDVLQTLFNSAEGLANCSPESTRYWIWRFISDEALAAFSSNILFWEIPLLLMCYKLEY